MFTVQPIRTNQNSENSFQDCEKCKTSCNVLNFPFKEQKPTMTLFGDGTHCFARKATRDYEAKKPSPLPQKYLRQSQSTTPEHKPKKDKNHSIYGITVSNFYWLIQIIKVSSRFISNNFNLRFSSMMFCFQRSSLVGSRRWTRFCCSDCEI